MTKYLIVFADTTAPTTAYDDSNTVELDRLMADFDTLRDSHNLNESRLSVSNICNSQLKRPFSCNSFMLPATIEH
jgi:hypothetical protein